MEEQIFNTALNIGIFGALFIWLLFTTMKKNEVREKEYQKTISENQEVIREQVKSFSLLLSDIAEIKGILKGKHEEEVLNDGNQKNVSRPK
ncbi:BhlA/UviB family holin-like peptide [Paenibacillus larvae]|uniref:BhlA/UviB family holin-like peptide n=1 Tax=Paenibacillus larvae TaxID=1464 RepID=UPI002282AF0E|nr:BhlA/UviB family holin-like peptide [Paenibacillus larvae]MCY9512066.1 BhlA/UviB family holin-like peptide [Paenibacillus larvae]MCY9527146.1 BhlA/UviB family holin-like peptide [Paenibacillus larvae]